MFTLVDKNAVITGAAGHLCSEMARGLASMGCSVAILDQRLKQAEGVAKEITAKGGNAIALKLDARKKSDFEECQKAVTAQMGEVDILINGAGINAPTPFMEITEAEFDNIIAVQLKGTMFGCQVFGQKMLEQGRGSIINISSLFSWLSMFILLKSSLCLNCSFSFSCLSMVSVSMCLWISWHRDCISVFSFYTWSWKS